MLVDDVVGAGLTLRTHAKRLQGFGLDVFAAFAIIAGNPGFPPPRKIKLGEREGVVDTLLEPQHIAWSHEQYVIKYGRLPQFTGVTQ